MSAIPKPKIEPRPRLDLIVYPESDGKPMADNTLQFRWMQTLQGNLAALYREQEVFVAGDLFWYPVQGFPEIVSAPDVMVAFGRPPGDRRSYKQWEENDVAPQVVFEVLSHNNSYREMQLKLDWYEDHGVEEYYVYDPDSNVLDVYGRHGSVLLRRRPAHGFVSPLMGIRFDLSGHEMVVYHPNGRRFLTLIELETEREREERLRRDAENRADEARKLADAANLRSRRLAELARKVRRGEATADELAELERLETEALG